MWKSRKKLLNLILSVVMVAGLALVAYTPNASALSLGTPNSGLLYGTTPPAGTVILSESSTFTGYKAGSTTEIAFQGTLYYKIERETSDSTLNFYYMLKNDASSTDAITRTTHTDFTNWLTDVEYDSSSAGNAPLAADRDSDGSTVGFSFLVAGTGDNRLGAGDSSKWYFIDTDATSYTSGGTAIINGGTVNVSTYAPSIPDPAAVFLLGSACLIGFSGLRRKFKK